LPCPSSSVPPDTPTPAASPRCTPTAGGGTTGARTPTVTSTAICSPNAVPSGRRAWPPPAGTRTIVAERDGDLIGFVHVVFDADPRWGSLVDNLHVAHSDHRAASAAG